MPKFYLTTPIYYVNARPHLGHAYSTIVADTIARYKRMRGYDAVLLTGTDEHGQKVERAAKAAGVTPQEFADRVSSEFQRLWQELDLGVNRFIRTTEWRHERSVQMLFEKARDNGYVYKGHYEGQYCVFDEMYVDEPLPGGLCPECKRPTERVREENYFFKLSAFQERLLALYQRHQKSPAEPPFVQPETRLNEVIAFVRGGLRDLSISRTSFKWGIPWPGDEKHIFYVWSDALTSYMSGVGYGDDEIQFEKYWPADLHLIGKEILRFHAVYWPAFLMAAEVELPKMVYAHGWWTFQGEKMSKSRGNIQDAQPIARVLGIDALRYFLLREMVFGQDGNFSREALVTRYNADLANDLGNLASRLLSMIEQYCSGSVPAAEPGLFTEEWEHQTVKKAAELAIRACPTAFDTYMFSGALSELWKLISAVNLYLVNVEPWKKVSHRDALETALNTAAEALRIVAVLAHPVIPHATQKIWEQLGQPGKVGDQRIDQLRWGQLRPGTKIGKPEAIFPRVDKEETYERIETMEKEQHAQPDTPSAAAKPGSPTPAAGAAPAAAATPSKISIEDFAKVEMRVGEVKSAERVAGADKLLRVLVDIGEEVRQVVAGIAEVYKPEELVGRKVVVVTNLQPRKLRGVESNGMIVAATVGPEGRPVLCTFTEEVAVGSRLK